MVELTSQPLLSAQSCKAMHKIDWATAKVINSAANTHTRKVKEALHIARKAPSMNKESGMSPSASWYASVVR